jgi:nitrous oxide reductase accessory protein NosL
MEGRYIYVVIIEYLDRYGDMGSEIYTTFEDEQSAQKYIKDVGKPRFHQTYSFKVVKRFLNTGEYTYKNVRDIFNS